jgi:Ca-activated chloride channel homolog
MRTPYHQRHLLLSFLAIGCSDAKMSSEEGGTSDEGTLSPGVSQGGAQDFGYFRQILLEGDIPGPETIDDVGFFNEHKMELPEAQCGEDVCIHGIVGMLGNMISGSTCTIILIGMNTDLDPDELERPPLNLAVVVDTTSSMSGDPMARAQAGLMGMIAALEPDDTLTLVTYASDAAEVFSQSSPDDPSVAEGIASLVASSSVEANVYDGLRTALDAVAATYDPARQNRVLFVGGGEATTGITNDARIVELASAYHDGGIGLSTIGLGTAVDPVLLTDLAEVAGGTFYFVEDMQAVEEIFIEEAETFLVPLASDARIQLTIPEGWDIGGVYGSTLEVRDGNVVTVDIESLQIAQRTSTDTDDGRRGGGGAIVAELLPADPDIGPGSVGILDFSYTSVRSGELVTQQIDVDSPVGPEQIDENGYFEDHDVEKAFVMLNIYAGFEMAAERAMAGDNDSAINVLGRLDEGVTDWLVTNPDGDIEDDLFYVELFMTNLENDRGVTYSPEEVEEIVWPNGD